MLCRDTEWVVCTPPWDGAADLVTVAVHWSHLTLTAVLETAGRRRGKQRETVKLRHLAGHIGATNYAVVVPKTPKAVVQLRY